MARVVGTKGYTCARESIVLWVGVVLLVVAEGSVLLWVLRSFDTVPKIELFMVSLLALAYWRRAEVAEVAEWAREAIWYWRGYRGESSVGSELERLDDRFVVFHDYCWKQPNGDKAHWDFDHIVVGPTGVFVVETKNHSRKRIRPAAQDEFTRADVKQVHDNAVDLKRRLQKLSGGQLDRLFVKEVLVYAQDGVWIEKLEERITHVMKPGYVYRFMSNRNGHLLSDEQVNRIARTLYELLPDGEKQAVGRDFDFLRKAT